MKSMKSSKIDWIGDIPHDWEITKIKYTAKLNGRIGWQGLTSAEYQEEGPYLITGTDFLNGGINLETAVHISENRWKEAKQIQVENGDLLITKDGTVGKVAIIEGLNAKASLNSGVLRIQPNPFVNRRFLYYVLLSEEFWLWFNYTNSGASTILHLYQNVFSNFSFAVPPMDEQKKIVFYLDEKISKLNKSIKLLKKQIEKLNLYRKSIVYQAVTKGLDDTVKYKESNIDWIGSIPIHWEIKPYKYIMSKVKEICHFYSGENILSLTKKGVIVRDIENAKGKMPATFDGYQKINPGNLLLCLFDIDVTPRCIGKINDVGLTSPAYSQFVMKDGNVSDYYFWQLLFMDDDKVLLHLSKNLRSSLTEDDFGIIKTIVPPIDEQVSINKYLEERTNLVDNIINKKRTQIQVVEKQKETLIYDYVTGKKRVNL